MGKRQEKGEDFVSKIGVELEDLYKVELNTLRLTYSFVVSGC
jgi:hypothetical protein